MVVLPLRSLESLVGDLKKFIVHAWGVPSKIHESVAGVKEHAASAGILGGRLKSTKGTFADPGVVVLAD